MDWGNASDLASAGCNIVMASAALYAAVNAKRWFSQKSHTKGFEKAEELLSQIDHLFSYTNKIHVDLYNVWAYLEKVEKSRGQVDPEKNAYFISLLEELQKQLDTINRVLLDLKLIERWSIKLKNYTAIADVLLKLHESIASCIFLYSYFKFNIRDVGKYRDSEYELIDNNFKVHYIDASKKTEAVIKPYEKLVNLKFTQLFAVK